MSGSQAAIRAEKAMKPAAGHFRFRTFIVALLYLGATTGCLPLAVLAGAGLMEGGGDGPRLGNAQPYGGPKTSPQNGRPDPTIGDALRASDREISEACLTALAAMTPDPATTEDETARVSAHGGGCSTRPVCLPGFSKPMPMRLCAATRPAEPG